jgi:threonine aldolase
MSDEPPAPAPACQRLWKHDDDFVQPAQVMRALASRAPDAPDLYGTGRFIAEFESGLAHFLGKENALFMPSGTMAQQIALRILCDRAGSNRVALHCRSHLEEDEFDAYRVLHNLAGIVVGSREQPLMLSDLEKLEEQVAVAVLELPQRKYGGWLPPWNELLKTHDWAQQKRVALHLDGARLWEAAAHYEVACSEIAGLFETVYVSFYKGVGGIGGAALAGTKSIIDSARTWMKRHGGQIKSVYPYVLAAERGLQVHIPRMAEYRRKALELAGALRTLPGFTVVPDPPHVNMFHVYLPGDVDTIRGKLLEIRARTGVSLCENVRPAEEAGRSWFELPVGSAATKFSTEIAVALFAELARSHPI